MSSSTTTKDDNPQWHDGSTGSTQTSDDRMTPSSDSDSDDEEDAYRDAALHKLLHGEDPDGVEAYELGQTRTRAPRATRRVLREAERGKYNDEDSDGEDEEEEEGQEPEQRRGRTRRRDSAASFQLYTPDEEARVVRKFDRRLVVFVAVLYMLSFLDRSNIGNARIAGMDADLQPSPPAKPNPGYYEWSLTAFYIAYIAFEWMSLLWRLIPAHIYVSVIVLSWGLTASLQAVAVNYPMLIFLRVLLGIGEAGFTGIPFYLSFFFKRHELAFRTAIFISAAPLATTFASSLAWVIIKVGESGPIAPWRLLFLLEGFPSVLIAVMAWNVVPDSPQTAKYLTRREKKVARLRLRPRHKSHTTPSKRLNTRDVLSVLWDPVAWLTASIFFLTNMAYSSLPVFLPTILTAMGHDSLSANALAAPPYLAAFLIVLATAHVSDMMKARSPLLIAHALASAGGYGILAVSEGHLEPGSMVRYLAVYPAAIGFFNVVVLTIAWSINNQRNESRQGAGFALLQVVGQCGPLVGTRLYPDRDMPYYTNGMRVCAGAMLGVAVLAGVLRWYLAKQNRTMDTEGAKGDGDGEGEGGGGDGDEEVGLVGGASTGKGHVEGGGERFRYML
ncbi:high-affinity nicotinic acid transporter [Diplogelasinospora grovesii]|uniref:High-affinity nicotinic acid transporter n=1 Tax=Diplogelasinospora grovesii TaxID=303347 RepID=A0AAN6S9C9_9PEZI|nr:high-affinity nicotinic acid transporter [Diplogelasinospora grovesii]